MSDMPEKPVKPASNMRTRILSALVLAPLVLALIWIGGFAYGVLVAFTGFMMLYEWTDITGKQWASSVRMTAFGLGALTMCVLLFAGASMTALVVILIGAGAMAAVSAFHKASHWPLAGFCYASLSAFSLIFLRDGEGGGLLAIAFLIVLVWSTDIFAYFVGKTLGGPKLAPAISPGKTWSGAIGGLVFAVLLASLLLVAFSVPVSPGALVLIALLSIVSQAGDLLESWVKRRFGVKDSGWIIPGHGGILDRVDGLVAAAVAMALFSFLTGHAVFAS